MFHTINASLKNLKRFTILCVSKQMPNEHKVIEVPNQVSTAKGTVNNINAEENKEERNLNGTKQEEDSEVKEGLKSSADGSEKVKE